MYNVSVLSKIMIFQIRIVYGDRARYILRPFSGEVSFKACYMICVTGVYLLAGSDGGEINRRSQTCSLCFSCLEIEILVINFKILLLQLLFKQSAS
jgi:hypothetical protein